MNVFSLHNVFLFVSFKKKNINTQNQCTIELLKKCAYLTKEIILYIFYSLFYTPSPGEYYPTLLL